MQVLTEIKNPTINTNSPIMPGVAPHTLHNAEIKYRAQLEGEWIFIRPLTSRLWWLFFLPVVIAAIP